MQIVYRQTFEFNLLHIIDFIATDKPIASVNFANELEKLIFNLPNFPYKNRQSIYFNDENIRDMVFKGYTIVYKINIQKNLIEILDIFNQNKY
jgi:plasmid stabilization system protein ParE